MKRLILLITIFLAFGFSISYAQNTDASIAGIPLKGMELTIGLQMVGLEGSSDDYTTRGFSAKLGGDSPSFTREGDTIAFFSSGGGTLTRITFIFDSLNSRATTFRFAYWRREYGGSCIVDETCGLDLVDVPMTINASGISFNAMGNWREQIQEFKYTHLLDCFRTGSFSSFSSDSLLSFPLLNFVQPSMSVERATQRTLKHSITNEGLKLEFEPSMSDRTLVISDIMGHDLYSLKVSPYDSELLIDLNLTGSRVIMIKLGNEVLKLITD